MLSLARDLIAFKVPSRTGEMGRLNALLVPLRPLAGCFICGYFIERTEVGMRRIGHTSTGNILIELTPVEAQSLLGDEPLLVVDILLGRHWMKPQLHL